MTPAWGGEKERGRWTFVQHGSFCLPQAHKIKRGTYCKSVRGGRSYKTPEVAYLFFGQRAENEFLLGLADAFLKWQNQGVISKNREQKGLFTP